jgi:hypothetical protein
MGNVCRPDQPDYARTLLREVLLVGALLGRNQASRRLQMLPLFPRRASGIGFRLSLEILYS